MKLFIFFAPFYVPFDVVKVGDYVKIGEKYYVVVPLSYRTPSPIYFEYDRKHGMIFKAREVTDKKIIEDIKKLRHPCVILLPESVKEIILREAEK